MKDRIPAGVPGWVSPITFDGDRCAQAKVYSPRLTTTVEDCLRQRAHELETAAYCDAMLTDGTADGWTLRTLAEERNALDV